MKSVPCSKLTAALVLLPPLPLTSSCTGQMKDSISSFVQWGYEWGVILEAALGWWHEITEDIHFLCI